MNNQVINLPQLSLVLLVGVSGSGKSTFARKHFKATEVISSDYCRALVADDENDQTATRDAFEVLNFIAGKRLAAGKLTVIDATNVQAESRKSLIELAKRNHVLAVAIVFNIDPTICSERNVLREDRDFEDRVIHAQYHQLQRSLNKLRKSEGFTRTYILNSVDEINSVIIERHRLYNDKLFDHGPFDIIGDIHGCFDELIDLLQKLNYQITINEQGYQIIHPENRKIVFVGDLVDRGPKSPDVLKLVMSVVTSGVGYCVNGNHDNKLKRKLMGNDVQITHGLKETLAQLENESHDFKLKVKDFLDGLISHYVFDDGKLAVAHAGLREKYIGRGSARIRDFCMYGDTTGETDEFGLPIRYEWAKDYRGNTIIVYGHTPILEPEWLNNTINIDTGCVFGGKLTALRYPEKEIISVSAAQMYYKPIKPIGHNVVDKNDIILDIEDIAGKRIINTQLLNNITIREENSIAAIETMTRFAIDPRWLIYLPPTMSPSETSHEANYLEHPREAINYFHKRSIYQLICQEKHMGSRAIVIICKNNQVAKNRFKVTHDAIGICYTRTGRNFFSDNEHEQQFLEKVQNAVSKINLWEQLNTDWLCLDCEIMPWSAKAQSLIEKQYAAVGCAAEATLHEISELLLKTKNRAINQVGEIEEKFNKRLTMINAYRDAYRRYCWNINSIEDYKLAPFHILAFENQVNLDKNHLWHLNIINQLCDTDANFFKKTNYKILDTNNAENCDEVIAWWHELTSSGGEGMVVKPLDFTIKTARELIQPGIKCRGQEYLRIIYGPEYLEPANLEKLRSRHLGLKRSLALREFALGHEALNRFINFAPLYKVHEAVFGILALESEPVDPRL